MQLSPLLDELLDLDTNARASRLSALAREDATLAADLEHLLVAHGRTEDTDPLASLPVLPRAEGAAVPKPFAAGDRVGPWALVEPLGEGGMATVWLARRADGAYQREVALKLPRRLGWSDELAQRLVSERDILARLENPHIARFYDAGVSEAGLPWLAMERVQGELLTTWCDGRRLDVRARVALFLQVLDAVSHAHAALVLHRDLKPSNILVNDAGEVRLLDFGIARLLDADGATSETRLYAHGARVLTPDYASPEQIRGEPLTTASDIYSLGVILYELLCGKKPYRLRHRSVAALEQAVLDAQPARPSTRTSQRRATERSTTPRRLSAQLRTGPDAIVLTALRKAPGDRYASAADLRADLQRWLEGRPVQAQHAPWWHRARLFVGRHRVGVGVATVVTALLTTSTAVSLVQSRHADREAQRAQAISSFVTSIFRPVSWLNANPARGQQVTAREMLDVSLHQLEQNPIGDADVHADLLNRLYDLYGDVGAPDRQIEVAQALRAQAGRVWGEQSVGWFDASVRLARVLDDSDAEGARAALRDAGRLLPLMDDAPPATLARYYLTQGDLNDETNVDVAVDAYQRALSLVHDGGAAMASMRAEALIGLGSLRALGQGRLEDGRRLYIEALAELQRSPDHSPFELIQPEAELADVNRRLGHYREARLQLESAYERSAEGLGAHTMTLMTGMRLAVLHLDRGEAAAAETLLDRLTGTWELAGRPNALAVQGSLETLRGWALQMRGRYAAAAEARGAGIATLEERYGTAAVETRPMWLAALAGTQAEGGDLDGAARSLDAAQSSGAPYSGVPRVAAALAQAEALREIARLGEADPAGGRSAEPALAAIDRWASAIDEKDAVPVLQRRMQARLDRMRAEALWRAGRADEAWRLAQRAVQALTPDVTEELGDAERGLALELQARIEAGLGRSVSACALESQAARLLSRDLPGHPQEALARRAVAWCAGQAPAASADDAAALAGGYWRREAVRLQDQLRSAS